MLVCLEYREDRRPNFATDFSWLSISPVCCQQKQEQTEVMFSLKINSPNTHKIYYMAPKWINFLWFPTELPSFCLHGQLSLSHGENGVRGGEVTLGCQRQLENKEEKVCLHRRWQQGPSASMYPESGAGGRSMNMPDPRQANHQSFGRVSDFGY